MGGVGVGVGGGVAGIAVGDGTMRTTADPCATTSPPPAPGSCLLQPDNTAERPPARPKQSRPRREIRPAPAVRPPQLEPSRDGSLPAAPISYPPAAIWS